MLNENVLPESERYHPYKDSKGYVWIGSDNGLVKFDGNSSVLFQSDASEPGAISENLITSKCFEDKNGNLWFTTLSTIQHYNRNLGSFTSFQIPEGYSNAKGLYLEDGEKFWIKIDGLKAGGLFEFDIQAKTFENQGSLRGDEWAIIQNSEGLIQGHITGALPKESGILWYNTKESKIEKIEFDILPSGEKRIFSSPSEDVLMQSDTVVWVGLYNAIGRYKLGDSTSLLFENRVEGMERDVGWVYDMAFLNDQHILCATTKGLFLFDVEAKQFRWEYEVSSHEVEGSAKNLNRLYLDTSGFLLVSNDQQEVAFTQLNKRKFKALKETIGTSISSIVEDRNANIWVSTMADGTFVYDQEGRLMRVERDFIHRDKNNNLQPLPSFSNFIANGKNWWGQYFNFFFNWNDNAASFEFRNHNFLGVSSTSSDRVNCHYQLSNEDNLIALGSVVYKLELGENEIDTVLWKDIDYLNLKNIVTIYEDEKKRIYLCDDIGRLVVIEIVNEVARLLYENNDLGICHSFLQTASDDLWLVSSKGLFLLNLNQDQEMSFLESADLMSHGSYNGVVGIGDSIMWLSGPSGLSRFSVAGGKLHKFTKSDGLVSTVFHKNAHHITSKHNELWIGGKNGVQVFKPSEIHLLDQKPNVEINNILINDEPFSFDYSISELRELELDHKNNTLSFSFTALDYSDPESNQFYYQMVGVDEQRVSNGNRGFVRYANMLPGAYVFKVWTTNSDLVLNETPLSLGITILPPFYQTWWFISLCILAIAAVIYAIFQYRLEQALKVERLRVKISSDLHDDVGGLLSGLAMQSEILELTADDKVKPKLKRISEISRSAMSRMRDTVWAIDARKDKMEDLIDRMNEHAEELLSPKNIAFNVASNGLKIKKGISTDTRQNIYLIYKEAITNIAKHSDAKTVDVLLRLSQQQFTMKIQDDGQIKEKSYKTTGAGLSNMKMRASKLGGTLTIENENGFQVVLIVDNFKY